MKKTKSLFYEMRMRKKHMIVVYIRLRTLHEANDLSLMASNATSKRHFLHVGHTQNYYSS